MKTLPKLHAKAILACVLAIASFILLLGSLAHGQSRDSRYLRYVDARRENGLLLKSTASSDTGTRRAQDSAGRFISEGRVSQIHASWPVTLTTVPNSQTAYQRQSVSYTINVSAIPGLNVPVALTTAGIPGIQLSLVPAVVRPGETATLAFTTSLATSTGTHATIITGSAIIMTGTAQLAVTPTSQVSLTVLPASIGLTANPPSRSVFQGQSVTYTVAVTATPGLTFPVALMAAAMPEVDGDLFPTVARPGETAILAVTTSLLTTVGTHSAVITGTATVLSGTNQFAFTSTTQALFTVLAADYALDVTPSQRASVRGETVSFLVSLASATPNFAYPVTLDVAGIPDNTPFSFIPSAISPSTHATLFITVTGETRTGSHEFRISGAANGLVRTTDVTLVVKSVTYLPLILRGWPPAPAQPTLQPINNADGDGNYTVSWIEQPVRLAETYTLQEATDANFVTNPRDACVTEQQECTIAGHPIGTYYYRVRGCNKVGCGEWSIAQPVTVLPPTPTPTPTATATPFAPPTPTRLSTP